MAQSKVTTETLLNFSNILKQNRDSIMQVKQSMDNELTSFPWDDPVGRAFIRDYYENLKPVEGKLVPNLNSYSQYLDTEASIIEGYDDFDTNSYPSPSVAAWAGAAVGAACAAGVNKSKREPIKKGANQKLPPLTPEQKEEIIRILADEKYKDEMHDRIRHTLDFGEIPSSSEELEKIDKDDLVKKLNKGIEIENKRSYMLHDNKNFSQNQKEILKRATTIEVKDGFVLKDNHGRFNDKTGNIILNSEWVYNENTSRRSIVGAVMHEYEHKQQFDRWQRGEISKGVYEHYDAVSENCKEKFRDYGWDKAGDQCHLEYQRYKDNWQEVLSEEAESISDIIIKTRNNPQ